MPEDLIPVFDVTMNLRHFEPELVLLKTKTGWGHSIQLIRNATDNECNSGK